MQTCLVDPLFGLCACIAVFAMVAFSVHARNAIVKSRLLQLQLQKMRASESGCLACSVEDAYISLFMYVLYILRSYDNRAQITCAQIVTMMCESAQRR